jgi:IclR family acetate operon transcriptional repressor
MTEVLRVPAQPAAEEAAGGVLENGLALLPVVAERLEVSAAQVAQSLRMSRSSTYRLIDRLRTAGYLQGSATPGIFHLGLQAVPIGA